jgi:hypothetical protein
LPLIVGTNQLGVRHFSRFLRKPALSDSRRVARDAVATRRGFGFPQATSQEREVAHPAHPPVGC